ncbi:MAG: hypothetical protein ACQESK_08475 [Bacteroidota bacterium]
MIRSIFVSTIFSLLFCVSSHGQNQSKEKIRIDDSNVFVFLEDTYGTSDSKVLYENNNNIISEMKHFLNNQIYIVRDTKANEVDKKLSSYNYIGKRKAKEFSEIQPSSFNPFAYGLDQLEGEYTIHIDSTNYLIIIKSN